MVNGLKIKVCGMRDSENIMEAMKLPIDLMGFIFYEKSPRYVTQTSRLLRKKNILRVGVFVNVNIDFILDKIKTHQLDYIQLHGDETPEYFNRIQTKTKTIKLIKAFRVNEDFDFSTTKNYEKYCTYFLFDTKKTVTNAVHPPARSKGGNAGVRGFSHSEKYLPKPVPQLDSGEGAQEVEYGGTGKKFNWEILKQYTGNTPFLLSGGIGAEDAEAVRNFSHPKFAGIDINSKFEIEPALKDIPKIEDFLGELSSS